ncbi:MAG: tetratricopeptide repeat protein [Treponema sp.]|jgi:tetratricopeptide (TPR) repeat protein|nr:tetratricopeptide repeat protein [Treponema sp.]
MKKNICIAVIFLLISGFAWGQNSFSRGEELFMNNKPEEALKYLESAVVEDPAFVKAYLYLGIVYIQLKRPDDTITIYKKILPRAGSDTALIAYNLGNAYFIKGQIAVAQQYYSQAIDIDGTFASAYLNRANSLIRSGGAPNDAVPDYRQFLALEPQSPKKQQIERLITFIQEEHAAEERRRILAEELARQEEERRRQLLDDVAASLQAASTETRGVSAGAEDVLGYEGEFELE